MDCKIGCKGCFNEALQKEDFLYESSESILDSVERNPFNKGLILAGLEWSLQPEELMCLIKEAQLRKMPVIVYTGYSKEQFFYRVPEFKDLQGEVYLKYGAFDEKSLIKSYFNHGVKLASSNQKIELIEFINIPEFLTAI